MRRIWIPSRARGGGRWARTALLAAQLVLLATAASAARPWHEVRSPGFVVVTDAGRVRGIDIAREFEEIRFGILQALPSARDRDEALHILATDDEHTFELLVPGAQEEGSITSVAGLFYSGLFRDEIIMRTDVGGERPFGVLYHEYFHSIANRSFPGMPLWLSEGLAEFYSAAEIRSRKVRLGLPMRDHLALLHRGEQIPLGALLRGGVSHRGRSDDGAVFYAQSWALVHMLLMDPDPTRWPRIDAYVELLGQGFDEARAWDEAFDQSVAATEAELRSYVRRSRLGAKELRTEVDSESGIEVRRLDEAEVSAILGNALVNTGHPEEGLPLLAEALAARPELTIALEGLAYAHYSQQRYGGARAVLEKSSATGRASRVTPFLLALLSEMEGSSDPTELARAEQLLFQSLSSSKEFAPAWSALARLYSVVDPDAERVVAMSHQAVRYEPGSAPYHLLLARALSLAGRDDEAREEATTAARFAAAASRDALSVRICSWGGTGGFAEEVRHVCDQAVRLDPQSGSARDARGIVRVQLEDHRGAIEDFRFFLRSPEVGLDTSRAESRKGWIAALERGETPFDAEVLLEISDLPF